MKAFYYKRYGKDWDRNYRLVVSTDPRIPAACNMYHPQEEMYMQWGNEVDTKTVIPAIVAREILSVKSITGRPGHTMKDLADISEIERGLRNDSNYMYSFMGDHYPILEIWRCDVTTGKATLLAAKPPPGSKPW